MRFRDRQDAGQKLAKLLMPLKGEHPIVLGLPRGGIPVAFEVAKALGAELDMWIVRKVGAPAQPELGLGAVAEGDVVYVDPQTMAWAGVGQDQMARLVEQKKLEVAQRVALFRGQHAPPNVAGRCVIVVDDGIATGGTVLAALQALRTLSPKRIVLAVPVASPQTLERMKAYADEVYCVMATEQLDAIGAWYEDFTQTPDTQVFSLLAQATQANDALS